jgi:hypothetical protein
VQERDGKNGNREQSELLAKDADSLAAPEPEKAAIAAN